jgi:glycine cleavage system H lipoate-binding protein
MTTFIEILEAIGSFVLGAAGRIGLFLVAALVLAVPALLAALAWRALRKAPRNSLAHDAHLAPNHTWLAPWRRGAIAVGLDEVAERILPSATSVELPRPGMVIHRGDPVVVIRAGKRAVRVGSPVDGTVAAVNHRLGRSPGLVKEEPYGRGWLFAIEPASDGWKELPGGLRADSWLLGEKRRLAHFLEDELGVAAADGGELLAPAPALLGDEGWDRLVAEFLNKAA